jgi:beta-fructofuranosidase
LTLAWLPGRQRVGVGEAPVDPAETPTGPFDTAAARPLTNDAFYCGRLIHDRAGQPVLLAFLNFDQARQFLGELSDPMPVAWESGELKVTKAAEP